MNMKTRVWSGLGPGKTSTAAPTPVAEAEGAENIDKDETANSSSRESTTSDFSTIFVLAYMRYRYRGLISSSAPTKIKRPSHTRKDPSHSTSLPNIYHPHRGAEHHAPSSPFPLLPHRSNTIFRARAVSCHMSISGVEVIGCCSGFLFFVFLFSRSAGYPTRMMDVGLCACSCASVLNHEPKKHMS